MNEPLQLLMAVPLLLLGVVSCADRESPSAAVDTAEVEAETQAEPNPLAEDSGDDEPISDETGSQAQQEPLGEDPAGHEPTAEEAEACYVGRDVMSAMGSADLESLGNELESLTRQANRTENEALRTAAEGARSGYQAAERARDDTDIQAMAAGMEEMTSALASFDDTCRQLGIVVWEARN